MEEETLKMINGKIRYLLQNDDETSICKAIKLIKAIELFRVINNPLKCE